MKEKAGICQCVSRAETCCFLCEVQSAGMGSNKLSRDPRTQSLKLPQILLLLLWLLHRATESNERLKINNGEGRLPCDRVKNPTVLSSPFIEQQQKTKQKNLWIYTARNKYFLKNLVKTHNVFLFMSKSVKQSIHCKVQTFFSLKRTKSSYIWTQRILLNLKNRFYLKFILNCQLF